MTCSEFHVQDLTQRKSATRLASNLRPTVLLEHNIVLKGKLEYTLPSSLTHLVIVDTTSETRTVVVMDMASVE